MTDLINNRYELKNKLGQGGMGAVYMAYDRLTTKTVALKQVAIPEDHPDAADMTKDILMSIAVEFRTLAGLRHPHIISVMDYGFHEGEPFFTMEFLPGANTIVGVGEDAPQDKQMRLLYELLFALDYLHRRGVTHRDLKPDNVLVSEEGDVKVLDFGLAASKVSRDMAEDDTDEEEAAGTMAYMAPELFAGGSASIASDLYAVGVIAYEILLGKFPYRKTSTMALLQDIISTTPDTTELDYDLAEVLDDLLTKEADTRIRDINRVLRDLAEATGVPLPEEADTILDSFLQASEFVGREAELSTLKTHLNTVIEGGSAFVLIGGESGVGKSRLVDELRTRALVDGASVIRGQSVAEGGLPLQVWRDPARYMALRTELSDLEAGIIKEIVPDISTLLGREIPDAPQLTGNESLKRLILTLVAMFKRQTTATILLLEDLQWANEGLDVLEQMLKVADQLPMLFVVGTYRDDEAPELPDEFPQMDSIVLKRLDEKAIAALSASMLGEAGTQAQVVDFLQRETEGNAFFMVEVVRALAESAGRLSDVGQATLPQSIMAGGVQQVVRRRLERLPEHIQMWVTRLAIAGRTLDLDVVDHLTATFNGEGKSSEEITDLRDDMLRRCADAAVLEVEGETWRFAHEKIRETIIADQTEIELSTLHRQIAEAIEAVHPDDSAYNELLLDHWHIAGDVDKEMAYLGAVAQRLVWISADYERAQILLNRGLTALPDDDPRRVNLLNWGAQASWRQRSFDRATEYATDAMTLAEQVNDQKGLADSLRNQGSIAFNQRELDTAADFFQRSMAIYETISDQQGVAKCLHNLGSIAGMQRDMDKAAEFFNKSLDVARQIDDRRGQALTLNNLGSIAGMQRNFEQSADYFQQSLALAQAVGDQFIIADDYGNLGVLAQFQEKPEQAIEYLQKGLEIRRNIGDTAQIAGALSNLGFAYLDAGDARARSLLVETLNIVELYGVNRERIMAVSGFIGLHLQANNPIRAAELAGLIGEHIGRRMDVKMRVAEFTPQLEAALNPEALQDAMERGKTLDLDTVVDDLLIEFG